MPRRPTTTGTDRRAILLARVSSREQETEGYSLDAQLVTLREYAARSGLTIISEHVLAESAASAERRKAFAAVLRELSASRAPRHLVVEKTDRLTRNLRDLVTLDDLRLAGLEIHAVKEGLVIGPRATAAQLLQWDMQAMLARHYCRNLSEEVRKGMRAKATAGGWGHLAPVGLLNVKRDGKSALVHDPDRAPLVRRLFEAVAADGFEVGRATAHARAIGLTTRSGRPLARSHVYRLLRHPVLAGLVPTHDGRLVEGAHEAVVDRATWALVQQQLDSRRNGSALRLVQHAAFAGMIRCAACGRSVVSEHHKGRHGKGRHVYYRCASGSRSPCCKYVTEPQVVEALARSLDRVRCGPALLDRLRLALADAHVTEAASVREERESLARRQERIRSSLDTVYQDRLAGVLDATEYDRQARRLRSQLDDVTVRLGALEVADRAWVDQSLAVLAKMDGLPATIRTTSPEHVRAMARSLVAGVTVAPSGEVAVTLAEWAEAIARASMTHVETPSRRRIRHLRGIDPTGSPAGTSAEPLRPWMDALVLVREALASGRLVA